MGIIKTLFANLFLFNRWGKVKAHPKLEGWGNNIGTIDYIPKEKVLNQ
jgi:hypothetical protein